MMESFARMIQIDAAYANAIEGQQARRVLLINLVWIAILLLAFPLSIWWFAESNEIDAGTMFYPVSLAIALACHWLIRNGRLSTARSLFVLNILSVSVLAIFPDYRIDTPLVIVLTLPLAAAGVLLRRSGLFTVAAVLVLVIVVGGVAQISTDMAATPLGDTEESIRATILIAASIVLLTLVLLWMFSSSLDDVVRVQHQVNRLIAATSRIGETLTDIYASDAALDRAVEQLRDLFGLYHVQVFLTDPGSDAPVLRASTGFIGRRLLEEGDLLVPDDQSPINDALRQTDPILILESSPEEKRSGFLPATRSELLLPLQVGELLPMGVLDLHSTSRMAFPPEVLNALSAISNHMASALYGTQASRNLRSSYQERDRIIEQLETSQRELIRMSRQSVADSWGAYLEDRQAEVQGFDWHGQSTSPSTAPSNIIERTLKDGQVHLEHHGDIDVLGVPILLRGQTLGAIELRRSSHPRWSSSATKMAQAVAERLALSLENARLFEQAQTTARREQMVSEITSQLQSNSDLQTLLSMAATQFQDALGASHTHIRLGLPESMSDQT